MKRGNLVIGRATGEFTTKARPCLVVQSDESLKFSLAVNLRPLTTSLVESPLIRIRVEPGPVNGLQRTSEIEVDLITTMRKSRRDTIVGSVGRETMVGFDRALKRWLGL